MSGIFKGDSIYKSGGGGGGYKDGGQLIDGDFIEVKNNTVSSYDNVSRGTINFYFEAKDGEILNSIIELTTAVNATVNVYVLKNNFYYLLGNVGGNTVNAGNDYKINITGDSYAIDNVSGPAVAEYVEINGDRYKVEKIQNKYIISENYKGAFNGLTYIFNGSIPDYPDNIIDGAGKIIFNGHHFYRLGRSSVYDLTNVEFLDNYNRPWKVFDNSKFSSFSNTELIKFSPEKYGYIDTQDDGVHLYATQVVDAGTMVIGCLDGVSTPKRTITIGEYDLTHGISGAALGNSSFVNIRLYLDA